MKKLSSSHTTGVLVLILTGTILVTLGSIHLAHDSLGSDLENYHSLARGSYAFPTSLTNVSLGVYTGNDSFYLDVPELVDGLSLAGTKLPGIMDEADSMVAMTHLDIESIVEKNFTIYSDMGSINVTGPTYFYQFTYSPYSLLFYNKCEQGWIQADRFTCVRKILPKNLVITTDDDGNFVEIFPQSKYNTENFDEDLENNLFIFHKDDPNLFYLRSVCTHRSIFLNDIVPYICLGAGVSLILFAVVFALLQIVENKSPKVDAYEVLTTV